MEITGILKTILPEQQVSASFRKREFVVRTDEQYPQDILIEFTQDKCDILKNYKVGQNVKVAINLRGREWVSPQGEARYFNTIQAWRLERLPEGSVENTPFEMVENLPEEEQDDLPF